MTTINSQHSRPRKSRADQGSDDDEFTPEEVEELVQRASDLLAELREVLSEMSVHMQSVASGNGGAR